MECCGKCKYHRPIWGNMFTCENEKSESYGLETQYDNLCEEFKERED